MKKFFIATISAYLLLRFISSCATRELSQGNLDMNSGSCIRNDTIDYNLPYKIEKFYLDLLPPSLGVQFYKDGIVFLSLSKNEGKMLSKHLSFGTVQAYYSQLADTVTGLHQTFSPTASFPYPCDALSFTNNFNTIYFTRESETDGREKIYHASDNGQQIWLIDPEPLVFCKDGYAYSHPALSADGSMMIFASDNPDSFGGMDLFITKKEGDKWAEPKNLGVAINTGGNELFPFLDSENNLYFSSDSLYGFGGYDIFICKFTGKGWQIPINLTKHINSACDEIAFTLDCTGGNTAFFTTRQKSRNGQMQLYKVKLPGSNTVNDPKKLSKELYSLALAEIDSSEVKKILARLEAESARLARMRADSIMASKSEAARLEAERMRAAKMKEDSLLAAKELAKKMKADSLLTAKERAARLEAERKLAAQRKADSLLALKNQTARLEAERKIAAQRKADSLLALKNQAARLEAERKIAAQKKADSLLALKNQAARLEAERKLAAQRKADSLLALKNQAAKLEAERKIAAQRKADSILAAKNLAARLEAERLKAEKRRSDSIEAARLEALNRANKDKVIYRVQFLSSVKPQKIKEITVNNVKYPVFEYFYLGEYRYTIGEFKTIDTARDLQNTYRKLINPQAFVAAFKNNERTLDPELLK
jgi:hypothetical protein